LTGADGKFSFSPPVEAFRIVALHDQGYAEASGKQFEPTHELKLQPWGRIEGTLRVGGKPLANQLVQASLDDMRVDPEWPSIQNESRALTDEKGHFLIDRLAPGEARVHWQPDPVTLSKPPDCCYQPPFVVVESGQTAHVEVVQEGGRPLIGWLTVPDDDDPLLATANWNAYLVPKLPEPPYPADLPTGNRQAWVNRWRLTEAATRYRRVQRGYGHILKLKPDRSFRVDEVQPGRYELHVQVRARVRVPGVVEGRNEEVATLTHEFGVAPASSSTSGPVDLGTLSVIRKEQE
jgi:hypothetical protein